MIDDRAVSEKILRHLDLAAVDAPGTAPAQVTGSLPDVDAVTE